MSLPDWDATNFANAQPVLDEWISVYGLPPALAYGMVAWESRFNPRAFLLDRNGGSVGLCQISLPTAQGLGYSGGMGSASDLSGLYDPDTNAQFGLLYLRNQLDRYNGDYSQALSAYNAGSAISGNLTSYVQNVLARVDYFTALFADASATPDTSGDTSGGADAGALAAVAAFAVVGALLWRAVRG